MRNSVLGLTASIALVGGCTRDVPPRAARSATTAAVAGAAANVPIRRGLPSVVGDTFVLVAIGSRSTRVPVSDSAPCGFRPFLRLVISDDHNFYHVAPDEPSCFGPTTDSAAHWQGEWSTYRLGGDTLHLFKGDGDETYYWVSGILSDDSLIQVSGDEPWRFVRIRPATSSPNR